MKAHGIKFRVANFLTISLDNAEPPFDGYATMANIEMYAGSMHCGFGRTFQGRLEASWVALRWIWLDQS